jgi:AcrR family transcriptional regulator
VLAAALELAMEEGPAGLHMEAIAKRAGVSKETLYRWWRSKTEVVLDALADWGEQAIPVPDTGSFHADLRSFLRASADSLSPQTAALLRHLAAAAATDAELAYQIRDRFLARRRAALAELTARAVARHEIDAADAALALDLVYGTLWYRLIFHLGPLDYAWADRLADAIARGSRPGASQAD